jgi:hypothetical protein
MDDSLRAAFAQVGEEADDLMDAVEAAYDEHASFSEKLETRVRVDATSKKFRELYAGLDEKDRFTIDRTVGRKISDLQKLATKLPTPPAGKPAEKIKDDQFFATRAPKSSRPPVIPGLQPGEKPPERGKLRVTGEIEAWCGRCMTLRTHVIAAMMGDQPAQVVCQSCGSRSRFREGPARPGKTETKPAAKKSSSSPTPARTDEASKQKNELVESLRAAEAVRTFSPKERYKAGEIIDHPEHGRGKIENTLPRSLLVRFPSGLKPLKLG